MALSDLLQRLQHDLRRGLERQTQATIDAAVRRAVGGQTAPTTTASGGARPRTPTAAMAGNDPATGLKYFTTNYSSLDSDDVLA